MTKTFISYSSKNRDLVEHLAADLELFVYDAHIWFDRELLRTGGQRWWDNILAEIRNCEVFIYAISPQILTSEPCKREYAYARALGKPILPVLILETEYRYLPVEIQAAQVVNFTERARTQQIALRDSLRNLPKALALPEILPTPPAAPLDPVGVLFDRIANLSNDPQTQRYLLVDIEDLHNEIAYRKFVSELVQRFLDRDDVVVTRNMRLAEDLFKKFSKGIETGSETSPSQTPSERTSPQPLSIGEGLKNQAVDELKPKTSSVIPLSGRGGQGGEVPDALTRARDFYKTGKRNKDWTSFYVTFNHLKIPDMRFCLVPTGTFQMGGNNSYDDEKPIHPQTFDQPFYIAQYPVTNAQWAAAVKAGAVKESKDADALKWYKDPQMAHAPVVGVTWHQCQAFATWAGCRLPTEREWEYAARGLDNLNYPWGNDFIADNVVYNQNSGNKPWEVTTKPAGASWVGASHLSGNVWEWVSSLHKAYPYADGDGREDLTVTGSRVLRGGSWSIFGLNLRAAYRNLNAPDSYYSSIGFRCALS